MSALPRLSLSAVVVGLASCTGSPQGPAAPAALPEAQLPAALIGTFDETSAACAEALTMARLTVSSDSLLFYYGYATVGQITPRAGGYDVEATLVQQEGQVEVVPEPATYRIEAGPDGGIRFGNAGTDQPAQDLVRCAGR